MAEAGNNPIYAALHALKASDLLKADRKDVVVLNVKDSVEHAVKVLGDAHILSAPVRGEDGSVLGFVDMLDIARYILAAAPNPEELKRDELESLQIAGRAIALVPLSNLAFTERDPLVPVFETNPASMPAKLMAGGLHRVALFSQDMQVTGIISQSDVVRYLDEHLPRGHLKPVGERSLQDLGYASSKIETVPSSATVLEALRRLNKAGVSALAVVDAHGKLLGNFSASDLRGLYREKFPHLLDSVEDFLKARSPNSLKPIVCLPSDSLTKIAHTLAANKLHHVWVVDEGKPVGVISGTDLCKIAVSSGVVA